MKLLLKVEGYFQAESTGTLPVLHLCEAECVKNPTKCLML